MKPQSRFRWSGWLAGSLVGMVAANCFLVLFVAGVDVFLGQPPQFMVPLVALLIASGSSVLSRRRRVPAEGDGAHAFAPRNDSPRFRRCQPDAPAYLAMTIIRRPPVFARPSNNDRWKGAVQ
jgi:hypothetical protein